MGFVDRLPKSMNDPAYAALVMEYVTRGDFSVLWTTIKSEYGGHTAEFRVFADALKIEGVRVGVSAYLAQQICDLIGCSLLTPRLAELMWYQRAVTVNPVTKVHTLKDTEYMATTAWMLQHSAAIDVQLATLGNPTGLRCAVGKIWALSNLLVAHSPMAINFGWQNAKNGPMCVTMPPTPAPGQPAQPRCHIIQDPGWAHPITHFDYSQIFLAVSQQCIVDNQPMALSAVLTDPGLAGLASYEGVMKVLRQPGVPQLQQIVKAPPCVGPGCPQLVAWTSTEEDLSTTTIAPPSTDHTALYASGLALVAVVTGFFGMLWLTGRPAPKWLEKKIVLKR